MFVTNISSTVPLGNIICAEMFEDSRLDRALEEFNGMGFIIGIGATLEDTSILTLYGTP